MVCLSQPLVSWIKREYVVSNVRLFWNWILAPCICLSITLRIMALRVESSDIALQLINVILFVKMQQDTNTITQSVIDYINISKFGMNKVR